MKAAHGLSPSSLPPTAASPSAAGSPDVVSWHPGLMAQMATTAVGVTAVVSVVGGKHWIMPSLEPSFEVVMLSPQSLTSLTQEP